MDAIILVYRVLGTSLVRGEAAGIRVAHARQSTGGRSSSGCSRGSGVCFAHAALLFHHVIIRYVPKRAELVHCGGARGDCARARAHTRPADGSLRRRRQRRWGWQAHLSLSRCAWHRSVAVTRGRGSGTCQQSTGRRCRRSQRSCRGWWRRGGSTTSWR